MVFLFCDPGSIEAKKGSKRLTDMNRCEETLANFRLANKAAKKAAARQEMRPTKTSMIA